MAITEFEPLLTTEEFGQRTEPGYPEELVRGRIVPGSYPEPRHGLVCSEALWFLDRCVRGRNIGRVFALCGYITTRDPDTVRGIDASFVSYDRLPGGPLPSGYSEQGPEVAIEVISSFDRPDDWIIKADEFLGVGTLVVVVLDPGLRTAHVLSTDTPPRVLSAKDDLTLPGILSGFTTRVGSFFE
jgi:Uma2 family endonuclease